MINEMLMKKVKYLLSFKVNANESSKYIPLLEKVFYEFIVAMEENYNYDSNKNTYYNLLLNKLNNHIKSIIIPSNNFYYHPLGFLELSTDLKNKLSNYDEKKVNQSLKENIFKNNYFYQLLLSIKTTKTHIGFCSTDKDELDKYGFSIGSELFDENKNSILEKVFTQVEALTLSKSNFIYRNSYNSIYPDGTTYKYFMYLHNLDFKYLEIINMVNILEIIINRKVLMDAEINDFKRFIDEFNDQYDLLLDSKRFDINNNNKRIQTPWNYILDLVFAISTGKSNYRKMEYLKSLNLFLFQLYEEKIDLLLGKTLSNEEVESLQKEVYLLEENMVYNEDIKLHRQMKHVLLLNEIKKKINQVNNTGTVRTFELKEFEIINKDKNKKRIVKSSFQPIKINENYVSIQVIENFDLQDKYLIKFNTKIYNFNNEEEVKYSDLYLLVDKIKYLYTSFELGVITKESDLVRTSIAVRLINPDVIEKIKSERYGFVGEFVYSEQEMRCLIYKNLNILEYLKNKV